MKLLTEIFSDLWQTHRGRLVGIIIGLFLGIMILTIGFFSTLLLIFLMTCGYLLGNKIDNKEDILELLDKILPRVYHK